MLTQSPGNRLSHLATRRAVFSSANLLSCSQTLPSSRLGNKPLTIDTRYNMSIQESELFLFPNVCKFLIYRKIDKKGRNRKRTPKRYTPGKRKTPGKNIEQIQIVLK